MLEGWEGWWDILRQEHIWECTCEQLAWGKVIKLVNSVQKGAMWNGYNRWHIHFDEGKHHKFIGEEESEGVVGKHYG